LNTLRGQLPLTDDITFKFRLLDSGNRNFEQYFYLVRKQGGLDDTTTGVMFAYSRSKNRNRLL
jgi:hypothetical protein